MDWNGEALGVDRTMDLKVGARALGVDRTMDLKVGAQAFKVDQKVLGRQKLGQVSREVRKMREEASIQN